MTETTLFSAYLFIFCPVGSQFYFYVLFLIYCMLFKVMCAQKNDIKERFSTKNMMLPGVACFFLHTRA